MKLATRLFLPVLLLAAGWGCDRPTPVAPAESTLTITANPTRIAVNGTAVITVLARKSDGRAVNPGTEINFSTTLGTIDPVVVTDTRGVAEATLVGDGRIGMATVSAESGAAATASLDVQIGALASSMSLTANKSSVNKDLPPGGERIKLTAEVFDDLSNPIRNVSVLFRADTGAFTEGGAVTTNVNGRAKNTLVVTEVRNITDGIFEITASATGEGGTEVSETLEISVSGFALNITLSANPSSIPVTGGVVTLSALVRDDFGDALVNEGVNFISDAGSLASGGGLVFTDGVGQAFDTLTITEADLAALPAGTTGIEVIAEVAGSGGTLISSDPEIIRLQTEIPIAGFDTDINGLTVNFLNTSTGDPPLTYLWDFGDGGTSTSENPGNTYAEAGTYLVSLTATNVGGSDTLTKEVTVAAEPDLDVAPTGTISFGSASVGMGESVDRNIFLTNIGGAELNVSVISVSGSAFLLIAPPALPLVLQPGETRTLTVRFTPTTVSTSAQTATFTVISDDPDAPSQSRTLSGTGTT